MSDGEGQHMQNQTNQTLHICIIIYSFYLFIDGHQDFHQFHLVLAVFRFNDVELDSVGAGVDCMGFLLPVLLLLLQFVIVVDGAAVV